MNENKNEFDNLPTTVTHNQTEAEKTIYFLEPQHSIISKNEEIIAMDQIYLHCKKRRLQKTLIKKNSPYSSCKMLWYY